MARPATPGELGTSSWGWQCLPMALPAWTCLMPTRIWVSPGCSCVWDIPSSRAMLGPGVLAVLLGIPKSCQRAGSTQPRINPVPTGAWLLSGEASSRAQRTPGRSVSPPPRATAPWLLRPPAAPASPRRGPSRRYWDKDMSPVPRRWGQLSPAADAPHRVSKGCRRRRRSCWRP